MKLGFPAVSLLAAASLAACSESPDLYRAYYTGRARLLHFPEGQTEWEGTCNAEGKIEDSAPTLLQLVSHSAAALKAKLDGISEACIVQLERQFTSKS